MRHLLVTRSNNQSLLGAIALPLAAWKGERNAIGARENRYELATSHLAILP